MTFQRFFRTWTSARNLVANCSFSENSKFNSGEESVSLLYSPDGLLSPCFVWEHFVEDSVCSSTLKLYHKMAVSLL